MPSLRPGSLRARLRDATAPLHDRLDNAIGALNLADRDQYAQFLRIQLAAREPIERWTERYCPSDLCPPSTAQLLKADLSALGEIAPFVAAAFALPESADPIGLAWALAGSHLGNRVLRRSLGADLPSAFLDDAAMPAFWQEIAPRLEAPPSTELATPAIAAACAVFRHFLVAEQTVGAHGLAA